MVPVLVSPQVAHVQFPLALRHLQRVHLSPGVLLDLLLESLGIVETALELVVLSLPVDVGVVLHLKQQ